MPIVKSHFKSSLVFENGFIATVYSGLIRRLKINQFRERITLRDDDFIDLDWSYGRNPSKSVVILLHGMEGHGQRPYITGPALLFNENDIDAICVNFRCCSGELNLKYSSYHSGKSEDLDDVVKHVVSLKKYDSIFIKGISLGANMLLKYLGEGNSIPPQVKGGMAVSAPCDLSGSAKALHKIINLPYQINFLWGLVKRLKLKQKQFPDLISKSQVRSIFTLNDFDEVYTSRAHGFKNAQDYYEKASSLQFLKSIKTPVLVLNALNDSFLSKNCYPYKEAEQNPFLYLETPAKGGHVGFISWNDYYYNEKRALDFFLECK
jgi:predicted alpha/beta-fold hydrolase|tara:strand:- start:709 stop:1668 length:960 start_codon:yes stop_codon:yes gene_type:complete